MLGVYRLVLFASVCTALVLTGCAPIQPEPPPVGEQAPASPTQSMPQATMEPTATSIPDPPAPPTDATPESPAPPGTTSLPDAPSPDFWLVYVDEARGLSIPYPGEWVLFDPTKTELAELVEKLGEKANSEEIKELLETFTQAIQQEDLFVGMGFQFPTGDSRDSRFVNNINIISFHTEGLFLQLIAQMIAAQLDSLEGIQVDSADVVAGLRPNGAEVASIRYRSMGALFNQPDLEIIGWQVGVLSPEAERIVVLTFSIRSEDFAELEPLLTEIVKRVQWLE